MNKKRVIILAISVLVLALIFLLMLFSRLKPNFFKNNEEDRKIIISGQDELEAYLESQEDFVSSEPEIAPGMKEYAEAAKISREAKVIAQKEELIEIEYPDFRPLGDSVQQRTQYIRVNSKDFSPKEVYGIYPALVSLSFDALDDSEHKIVFLDEKLAYLSNTFSKNKGLIQNFIAPEPGEYIFYIDKEENWGVFKVSAK